MKRLLIIIISFAVSSFFFSFNAEAQKGKRKSKPAGFYRLYDINTVATIEGKVTKVEKVTPLKGESWRGTKLVQVSVKTKDETVKVNLGPDWYVDDQKFKVSVDDKVKIKGSVIDDNGNPLMIAAQVIKSDETWNIRDAQGYPAWSGGNKRGKGLRGSRGSKRGQGQNWRGQGMNPPVNSSQN